SVINSDGVGILGVAAGAGNVTIASGTVTSGATTATVNGESYSGGVIGHSTSGNVGITTLGAINAAGNYGVQGKAEAGDVELSIQNHIGVTDAPATAIAAEGSGNITIAVAEDLDIAAQTTGIYANSTGAGN